MQSEEGTVAPSGEEQPAVPDDAPTTMLQTVSEGEETDSGSETDSNQDHQPFDRKTTKVG